MLINSTYLYEVKTHSHNNVDVTDWFWSQASANMALNVALNFSRLCMFVQ
jgi:hypothetical protein